jgi:hypothetical protein
MNSIADTRSTRYWPRFTSPSVPSEELSVFKRVDDNMRYGEQEGRKSCFAFKGEVVSPISAVLILSYYDTFFSPTTNSTVLKFGKHVFIRFLYLLSFFHSNIIVNKFLMIFHLKDQLFNIFDTKIFNNFISLCVRHVKKSLDTEKHEHLYQTSWM